MYDTLKAFFGIFALLLSVFGSIGNVVTCLVCVRQHLRKTPTFVFIAFGAVVDIFALATLTPTTFTHAYFGIQLRDGSVNACKLLSVLAIGSIQCSAFLLVALSFERFLSVRIILWRRVYYNSKKAVITCSIMCAIFLLVNSNLFFTVDFTIPQNETFVLHICGLSKGISMWLMVNTFLYSFIPFGLLAISNGLLLYSLHFRKTPSQPTSSSNRKSSKYKSLNVTVIARTVTFICFTAPAAITNTFFLSTISSSPAGQLFYNCTSLLASTPAATNLLIQFAFNREFRHELNSILQQFKSRNSSVSSGSSKR